MKRGNELISIIVPVYNNAKYLEKCITSIISQTYSCFELILIDDGSTDNSLEICELFQKKDHRIIVMHQENAGVSSARNVGLGVMSGKYFCFVDSDDTIESDMLEKLYVALNSNNASLSICGFKKIFKKGTEEYFHFKESIEGKKNIMNFVLEHYLEWLVSSPGGKLYKDIKFSPGRFDEDISLGEDLKFNIQYFAQIDKLIVIEDCLYKYMDVEGSLTKIYKNGNYEAICNIYDTTMQYITRNFETNNNVNFANVNYKLFSFCISFMSQKVGNFGLKESKSFIETIVGNEILQRAVCNLPKLSFVRRMYVWGIKNKHVNWLWLLSIAKAFLNRMGLRQGSCKLKYNRETRHVI